MTRVSRLAARRRARWGKVALVLALVVVSAGATRISWRLLRAEEPDPPLRAAPPLPVLPSPGSSAEAQPLRPEVLGLTTFRGNATRSYYGRGPVPKDPQILWRYPVSGALCSKSTDQEGTRLWCGTGWTGQPNVVETRNGVEVRFGAYDRAVHVLDGRTGERLMEPFVTGDLIKGTITSDPDGFPLLYVGSRDGFLRILALDRGATPVELWRLSADSAPRPLWNDDWDSSPLIVGDYLLVGGENSWFYVIRLHRDYDDAGHVIVTPRIRMLVPGYDDELLAALGDTEVSIENSVALTENGVGYFANSGGLVQGWDISRVLRGGKRYERVFRFWAGEDIDASVVIDEDGFLYVGAELERFTARGREVGQIVKLDPGRPEDPVVWSIPVPAVGKTGGVWGTPGLYRNAVFVTTDTGRLLAINRATGEIAWEIELPRPLWSSPVIVNGILIVGDCAGVLHGYNVRDPLSGPPDERWSVSLGGCIESTPAVWNGMIYVGTRAGAVYGIGDA
ncbi:MAG: PQQ-binding-like beta-propeller repeat protein [Actinomycetota bacterium]